jgi:hypothetical protein
LCEKYNIPFLNYKDYEPIASNPNYFQDIGHMNHFGAEAYTKMLVDCIKKQKIQIDEKNNACLRDTTGGY